MIVFIDLHEKIKVGSFLITPRSSYLELTIFESMAQQIFNWEYEYFSILYQESISDTFASKSNAFSIKLKKNN